MEWTSTDMRNYMLHEIFNTKSNVNEMQKNRLEETAVLVLYTNMYLLMV